MQMAMHSLRVRRMSWMQICGHAHAIRSKSGERARLACWFRRHAETIFREARNFRVVLNGSGSPRLRDAIANTRDARAPRPPLQRIEIFSLPGTTLQNGPGTLSRVEKMDDLFAPVEQLKSVMTPNADGDALAARAKNELDANLWTCACDTI